MSYFDSLSYFSDNFEQRVADPAELGRQLFAHRMEADYVKTAIVELGTVAQFKTRARELTPAAKTLAGETAISWLFGVGGRASWGELSLTVKRAHKMAGNRNDRVLQKLEDAGVIVCTYLPGESWDRSKPRPLPSVIVSLSYDLWLPAEITCASCGSSGAGGKCASWCPQTPRELVAEKSARQLEDEREAELREIVSTIAHGGSTEPYSDGDLASARLYTGGASGARRAIDFELARRSRRGPAVGSEEHEGIIELPPASTEEAIAGVIRRGDGGSAIRRAIERSKPASPRKLTLAELAARIEQTQADFRAIRGLDDLASRKEKSRLRVFLRNDRNELSARAHRETCFDCGARPGHVCRPDFGCDDLSRAAGRRVSSAAELS